jgi:hypothetical protein
VYRQTPRGLRKNYCTLTADCYNPALSKGARAPALSLCAGVVKLVDTSDSKSDASDGVPVQVRPPVPIQCSGTLFAHT